MKDKYYVYRGDIIENYANFLEMAASIFEPHPVGIKYITSFDCKKDDLMPFDLSLFKYDVEIGE